MGNILVCDLRSSSDRLKFDKDEKSDKTSPISNSILGIHVISSSLIDKSFLCIQDII